MLVGNGELMSKAGEILREFFGPAYRYAKAVVDYGVGSVALAMIDNSSVGVAVYYPITVGSIKLCVIYYIAVTEGCRGLGIGKVLMSTIEETCAVDADAYIATTWLGNEPADRLYRSLGYTGYTWGELRRVLGRRAVDRLLKATCGYDDDVAYVKPIISDEDPLKLLKRVVDGGDDEVKKLWRETCLYTWLRLRGSHRT